VTAVHEAPSDYPRGKKGDVLTVEFTVVGIPGLGLNGGPEFKHSETPTRLPKWSSMANERANPGTLPLTRPTRKSACKLLILQVLKVWLLGLDSNRQPSG
jgi:hypothetical protein